MVFNERYSHLFAAVRPLVFKNMTLFSCLEFEFVLVASTKSYCKTSNYLEAMLEYEALPRNFLSSTDKPRKSSDRAGLVLNLRLLRMNQISNQKKGSF